MSPTRTVVLVFTAICALAFLFSVSGCTPGVTHNYAATTPQMDTAGKGRVVVAVHDVRPYVVSGEKRPSFVGLNRTAVGSPLDVRTATDRTLSEDWTDAVARSLRQRGFEPVAVPVATSDTSAGIMQQLRAAGGKCSLLFTVRDWKSDTYINTSLDYDVRLEVVDPQGNVIAQSAVRGRDDLGGGGPVPAEYARRAVLDAYLKKMQHMLNDPAVVKALR